MKYSFIFLLLPVSSFAFLVIDPINLIQNTLSAKNSVSSLINQVQSIKVQLKSYQENSARLGQFHYQDMASVIRRLDSITRQGQSLSYAMQNVDGSFKKLYPNYTEGNVTENYPSAYKNWNQTTHTTLNNSLQSIGLNAESVQQEDALMRQLQTQSQTAQGRLQVMQVANEIATENTHQLVSLKHLIAAQSNAQTAYMAHHLSENSYQEQSLNKMTEQMPTHFPAYRNNAAFGKMVKE
ncbi:MAG: P-type conjugative transfer protein TrbJ [Gammaproteobacteria bacterium RIFCSPHIGHO2_12_FULL_41_15]|nr:MAG: P-type conjugative transfer protein TrbJ [Gammaproteobacteria bacterium RIFCSPHIGHO2_12_FULL_41_15]